MWSRRSGSVSVEGERRARGRTLFIWTCWVPLASFGAARVYVDRFDGWGQWAAAPVLLGPVFLSAAFLLAGALLARGEQPRSGVSPSTWVALAIASVPCLWLAWRLLVTL